MLNTDIIDDRLPMASIPPEIFDNLLAVGYRLLGQFIIRHNYTFHIDRICRTMPLRIDLEAFRLSKSFEKLKRRNRELSAWIQPIQLNNRTEELFEAHSGRLSGHRAVTIRTFLSDTPDGIPVQGKQINVFLQNNNIAQSFIHLGAEAVSATYCIYDPGFGKFSLGAYTMLLELEYAIQNGFRYYYHGYVYDIPSQFDYKLNFTGLEQMNWGTGEWSPIPRLPVRSWRTLAENKNGAQE